MEQQGDLILSPEQDASLLQGYAPAGLEENLNSSLPFVQATLKFYLPQAVKSLPVTYMSVDSFPGPCRPIRKENRKSY